jgi:hypothetical protein
MTAPPTRRTVPTLAASRDGTLTRAAVLALKQAFPHFLG